jgi:hypothetical protein
MDLTAYKARLRVRLLDVAVGGCRGGLRWTSTLRKGGGFPLAG